MSTDIRVNCCPWNCRTDMLCSSSVRSASSQLTLTLGQPKTFKQHLTWGGHSPCEVAAILRLGAVAGMNQRGLLVQEVAPHLLPVCHITCGRWLLSWGRMMREQSVKRSAASKDFDLSASILWKKSQLTWPYKKCSYLLQLHQLGRRWTNVSLSSLGCMQDNPFLQWAAWAFILRDFLCRREEVDDLHHSGGCCWKGKTG